MAEIKGQLTIGQLLIRPGTERTLCAEGWLVCRICGGTGYVLGGKTALDLVPGATLVMPGKRAWPIRASQLATLRICHFALHPRKLAGLLTLAEQRAFELLAHADEDCVRVFLRDEAPARQFENICAQRRQAPQPVLRAEMLLLGLRTLCHATAPAPAPPVGPGLETRFRGLVRCLTAADLLECTTVELARQCGCSARHFRRLYSDCFGQPLVASQTQLRIDQAQRLLGESNAKVIEVALECGFSHLGFFNATFKRLVGMTPSEWRQTAPSKRGAKASVIHCPRDRASHKARFSSGEFAAPSSGDQRLELNPAHACPEWQLTVGEPACEPSGAVGSSRA